MSPPRPRSRTRTSDQYRIFSRWMPSFRSRRRVSGRKLVQKAMRSGGRSKLSPPCDSCQTASGGHSNAEWMRRGYTPVIPRRPTLKFAQRENRAFFGRVAFSSFRVSESRARKYVNGSHHGADQPLNVIAKEWRRRRTVDELDPLFAAGGFQCSGVKFRMFNAALLRHEVLS
jgi:hypothetical protein